MAGSIGQITRENLGHTMPRANTKAWKRLPLEERKAILAHEEKLRRLPCMATGVTHGITLHHCHGGSMKDIGVHSAAGMRSSDWLQIPLSAHAHTGQHGVDVIGVETWERSYGPQVMLLKKLCKILGYNVFERAGITGVAID